MLPTYTAKPGRRYRYYVRKSPRQHGWGYCPAKSVPARMIEDSVLDQLRTTLCGSGTRAQLNVPEVHGSINRGRSSRMFYLSCFDCLLCRRSFARSDLDK
jgi:hypothetical protein